MPTWHAAVLAATLGLISGFAQAQVVITPSTPGWAFAQEAIPSPPASGSGTFVIGPGAPPSGSPGSIQLTVGNPGGELFYTQQFAGTLLSQIAGLKYNTYVVSSGIPETANMQFDFDPGVLPVPPCCTGYQGRAVFTPALIPSAVTVGGWQTWDPMTQRAWWGSGSPGSRLLAQKCSQGSPCTWSEINGFFPNAKMLTGGIFGFKVGNSASAAVVSVDGFSMGTAGPTGPVTNYQFAPFAPQPVAAVPALDGSRLALLALFIGLLGWFALRRGIRERR